MCTLLTLSYAAFQANSALVKERIYADAKSNPDGLSLLLIDSTGAATQIRTFLPSLVVAVLKVTKFARFILHSRFATAGEVSLANTHGWAEGGTFYFHNGCLKDRIAYEFPVDSQAIGAWLAEGGLDFAIKKLRGESFANVIFYDGDDGDLTVNRSIGGVLHTDGAGNYSTTPFGQICQSVLPGVYRHKSKIRTRSEAKLKAYEAVRWGRAGGWDR